MYWQDIFVSRLLSKQEVFLGLDAAFATSAHEILLSAEIDWELVKDTTRIICQTERARTAHFPLVLEFWLNDETLLPQNDEVAIGKFCERLNCCALVSVKDSLDFYQRTLICNRVNHVIVFYDTEAYFYDEETNQPLIEAYELE